MDLIKKFLPIVFVVKFLGIVSFWWSLINFVIFLIKDTPMNFIPVYILLGVIFFCFIVYLGVLLFLIRKQKD